MTKKLLSTFALSILLIYANPAEAESFDLYVDDDADASVADGSSEKPFPTISQAIAAAALRDAGSRSIFVKSGTYTESLELPEKVKIYGENRNSTIIDGTGVKITVKMADKTALKNLTVRKGNIGIEIDSNAKADIKKVTVTKTKKVGIRILKSKSNGKELVTVEDSKVKDGGGKGLYIQKGEIRLTSNEITGNDEEGIDLRNSVKGTIRNNTIKSNGESGIELIIGRSDLSIKRNKITSNKSSGITAQPNPDYDAPGNIEMESNKIKSNKKYGLNCQVTQAGKINRNNLIKSLDLNRNLFSGNVLAAFAAYCPENLQ